MLFQFFVRCTQRKLIKGKFYLELYMLRRWVWIGLMSLMLLEFRMDEGEAIAAIAPSQQTPTEVRVHLSNAND